MSRREINTNQCREACRICALCQGRNYEQCYEACRVCDMCTQTNNPVYAVPYYRGNGRLGPQVVGVSPLYGRSNGGFYENPYLPMMSDTQSICGTAINDQYNDRMAKYRQCLKSKSVKECNEKFGCKNPGGFERRNTPPINPKYTNCQPCWMSGYVTY